MQEFPILECIKHILGAYFISIVVHHSTQYELNRTINPKDITTNIHNSLNTGHKCYILVQSQRIFYMDHVSIVVDHCTKYEQNQLIIL